MKMFINKDGSFIRIAIYDKKITYYNEISSLRQGDIYIGEVRKILPSSNAVFIDYGEEKAGFLPLSVVHPLYFRSSSPESLEIGQKLLVQIVRPPSVGDFENKGALLTTYICFGEEFTYIPNHLENRFVFGEEVDDIYKNAALKVFDNFKAQGSFVLKKNPNTSIKDFVLHIKQTIRSWFKIRNQLDNPSKKLLYSYHPLDKILKSKAYLIDQVQYSGFTEVFLRKYFRPNISFIKSNSVFKDIYPEIQEIFSKCVSISNGAYLIFDHCSAGHAIDVNMGSKTNKKYEEAALDVNLQAAEEICRQILLRNLSGMIFIDFIQLNDSECIKKLNNKLQSLLKDDESQVKIEKLNSCGIVCISRQYKNGICWREFLEPSKIKIEKQAFDLLCAVKEYQKGRFRICASSQLIEYIEKNIQSINRRGLHFTLKCREEEKWKIEEF
jgi:Rne/Rng family ribonuclease